MRWTGHITYMSADGAGNADIARATAEYVKACGVDAEGEMETVILGEEPAPLATYWGSLAALEELTTNVMVVGSDPRNSKMFGWELPSNVDCKAALRAVWKVNKKAKENVDAQADELRATLVTKPDQFHVRRGPGPHEGMYMLILENDNVHEVADMIEAVADPKLALRVDRARDAVTGDERVRISLQMAGMAGRVHARAQGGGRMGRRGRASDGKRGSRARCGRCDVAGAGGIRGVQYGTMHARQWRHGRR